MRGLALVARRLLAGNPGRLIVLVAGAVSVALATSAILVAASSSRTVVEQIVSAGWRGTYDLLVRPADAPSVEVDGQQLVPLDYLGLPTSGITREQWERIAQLPAVDVAAPVAALGWLKNNTAGMSVNISDPPPGQVYVIHLAATIGGQRAVDEWVLYAAADDEFGKPLIVGARVAVIGPLEEQGDRHVVLDFGSLPSTWGLVVGVDPEAEDNLIGLSSFTGGEYLTRGATDVIDPQSSEHVLGIPVVTAARSAMPGDVDASISIASGLTPDAVEQALLTQNPDSLEALQSMIQSLAATVSQVPVNSGHAELSDLLRPLRSVYIYLTPSGQLVSGAGSLGNEPDNGLVLVPGLAAYASTGDLETPLSLAPHGSWDELIDPQLDALLSTDWVPPPATFGADSTVYRDLRAEVPPPFRLVPLGTFDADALAARYAQAANYTPLGLYAPIPRVLVKDTDGNVVAQPLSPSLNPAGLNPSPPVGLTNLEAVEAVRGDHFIDAIRVRLKGLGPYSPETVKQLETVSQQIMDATGLHVDVVAGSSPVDVRVVVPGLGVMSERWTTLGTAARVIGGAEGVSGLLLGSVVLVVFGYLVSFGIVLRAEQAREITVLAAVGWRPRALQGVLLVQAAVVGSLAAALGVGIACGLATAANLPVSIGSLIALAGAVLGLHLLAAYAAARGRLGQA
jgi:hypothetical protein